MKLFLSTLSAAMLLAGVVNAATVTAYDEAVDGDAGNWISSTVVDVTGLGKLVSIGDTITVTGGTDKAAGDVRDIYAFSSATDFTISLSAFSVTSGSSGWTLFVDDGEFNGKPDDLVGFTRTSGAVADLMGTQSAGAYFLRIAEGRDGISTSYSFSVTAVGQAPVRQQDPSPVPLPAGLPLLIGGIGALAWMRRRKAV